MECRQTKNNRSLWQALKTLIIAHTNVLGSCELCGQTLEPVTKAPSEQRLLCQYCLADLPLFKQQVIQGDLLNWPAIHQALPSIHFDRLICAAPYITPLNKWLIQFKYQGRFEFSHLFAYLIAKQWQCANHFNHNENKDNEQSTVIAVPLHFSKWQTRGYNQAHLIAKCFAEHIQAHYLQNALIRNKANNSQVGKTGALRRKSLANSFIINKAVLPLPKKITLIDDVVTTGSTASAIAKLLKCYGVETVTVATVCLSLPSA